MTMTREELDAILKAHDEWLNSEGKEGSHAKLRYADLRGEYLSNANLRGADLRGANLRDANLCGANLRYADLRGANLCGANLRDANLCGANLCGANLSNADLRYANMRDADLCDADLSFSDWPLWCGSLDVKIDTRIAAQLLYHTLRAMQSCADDADVAKVLASEDVVRLANRFKRVVDGECAPIAATESVVNR